MDELNSIADPLKEKPGDKKVSLIGKTISVTLAPYFVNVIRVKMK